MVDVFIHPMALVETGNIGKGSRIWANTHIMQGARIGESCNIDDHCFIESSVTVKNNTTIKNGTMVWEGVTLDDGVFVGSQVAFGNDLYPRSPRLRQAQCRYRKKENWLVRTHVKTGASLGSRAVILAEVTIGEYAMVGAAAVVVKTVPPYAVVTGNPAQLRRWVCQCGLPLHVRAKVAMCTACGLRYREENGVIDIYTKQP